MYNLTVEEAAARLGVSTVRVYQLIQKGLLDAQRVSRIWLIDDHSVTQRINDAPQAGRPAKTHGPSSSVTTYTLMNRTHDVLRFKYDPQDGSFLSVTEVIDPKRAPIGTISMRGNRASIRGLGHWWNHRTIPTTRPAIKEKLEQLDLKRCAEIPFRSHGLSLSDQYWIRTEEEQLSWEEINFFDHAPAEIPETTNDLWLENVGLNSPDNTTEGAIPKRWHKEGAQRLLLKGGSGYNQEPYNEVVATALYRRLLKPSEYVSYKLTTYNKSLVSHCEAFVTSREEFIPAESVRSIMRKKEYHNEFMHYIECCGQLGVRNIENSMDKIIVCDYLLANSHRHWRSFGLIRNVETLELRAAPIFNSDTSLWCHDRYEKLYQGDYNNFAQPFFHDPARQLRLVNDYSWLDLSKLDGFIDEAIYILSHNPKLQRRLPLIRKGLQQRINNLTRMVKL